MESLLTKARAWISDRSLAHRDAADPTAALPAHQQSAALVHASDASYTCYRIGTFS